MRGDLCFRVIDRTKHGLVHASRFQPALTTHASDCFFLFNFKVQLTIEVELHQSMIQPSTVYR